MAKIRETPISICEKKFVLKNLQEHNRLDGRAFNEFRQLNIEFGRDWGCCLVSLGKTRVLAQVSCEIEEPKSSRPSEGILNINLELTPLAAMNFEAGRQSELSVQLNRILEKCIKDSKAVDLESLCIKVSEKVWAFRVDVNVLNCEGNILDCASVAALAALAHFRRPDVSCDGEETVVHSYSERDPIATAVHHYPVCISYAIFKEGNTTLADPSLLEEGIADAHLTVSLNAYKELCGLHLGGNAYMTPMEILQCTSKAASRAATVVQMIKEALEKNKKERSENKVVSFEDSLHFNEDFNLALKDVGQYLNKWTVNEQRSRKRRQKVEQMEVEPDKSLAGGNVEVLGKGSAALVPNDNNPSDVWESSSSSEDDEECVQKDKGNVSSKMSQKPIHTQEPIVIDDEDSEEEKVVILNSREKKKDKRNKKK